VGGLRLERMLVSRFAGPTIGAKRDYEIYSRGMALSKEVSRGVVRELYRENNRGQGVWGIEATQRKRGFLSASR